MISDENGDLAGLLAELGHRRAGGGADFPIVQANIASARRSFLTTG
jgi:hypothetical protein